MNHPEHDPKSRFPKKQPKGICRGCCQPITEPRRQTWCSTPCKKKFDPFWVKQEVWQRDRGECQMCHKPCTHRHNRRRYDHSKSYAENQAVFEAARQMRGEYDHIIPHIEGGLFVAENIRLLCHGCHVKRTSEWRKERNRLKKAALQAAKSSKASP